jgi:hypothetical protein
VDEVADEILQGVEHDLIEIKTALPTRRRMQELNRTDPAAVDETLAHPSRADEPSAPPLRQT